jgi:hypothetical protein
MATIRVDLPISPTGPVFTPVGTSGSLFVDLGDIHNNAATQPFQASQLGSTNVIHAGSTRALSAVWRSGNLYVSSTVVPNSGQPNENLPTAHWYRFAAPGIGTVSLADQGSVVGGTGALPAGTATYYPAVAVDANGNMAIGFSASGSSTYAGAYYAGRLTSDAAGTLSAIQTLAAGVDTYQLGTVPYRWGDYSGLAIDPDGSRFWVFNEYAMKRQAPLTPGRWGTRWGSFSLTSQPRVIVSANAGGPPTVKVFTDTGTLVGSFDAYGPSFTGGVRVATFDITGDGIAEIFTAPGPGGAPVVNVFNGVGFSLVGQYQVYGSSFNLGIFLTVANLGPIMPEDGSTEVVAPYLIVGPDTGGSPIVNIRNAANGNYINKIQAYGLSFTGGVRVATGEVDASDDFEILTAPGIGGLPYVQVFSPTGILLRQFLAYGLSFTQGFYLTTANATSNFLEEVIAGPNNGGGPFANVMTNTGTQIVSIQAFPSPPDNGVRVGAVDADRDGFADIVTAVGPGAAAHVKIFKVSPLPALQIRQFFPFTAMTSGLFTVGFESL